ncbi:hypothetical protein KIW84_035831 [Lathyrus oleraceus]|uniref:Transmembrane protein n=1 Tax=Pisum sativum TaxID=3888 RepID=A0A9D4Y3T2_PEA|nr:hypothetical protein KIW84_035831 [Pisum sativum]
MHPSQNPLPIRLSPSPQESLSIFNQARTDACDQRVGELTNDDRARSVWEKQRQVSPSSERDWFSSKMPTFDSQSFSPFSRKILKGYGCSASSTFDTLTLELFFTTNRQILVHHRNLQLGHKNRPHAHRHFQRFCCPANLFRKMAMDIIRNKKVKFWKKVYVIYNFFFVRKIVAHMVTFFFYCLVIPLTILVPEVYVPIWGAVYIPSIITIPNSVGTPRLRLV